MNWLNKIKSILGGFWAIVFSDKDFTLGVEKCHALMSKHQQTLHDQWVASGIAADTRAFASALPFPIWLLKSETRVNPSTGNTMMTSCVVHPAASWDDILNGNAGLDSRQDGGGFVVQSRYSIPMPRYMSDHVIDFTLTLFDKADFTWDGHAFLFHVDPTALNLPEVSIMDSDGILRVYWKMFGWSMPERAMNDMVNAIYSPELSPYSDIVWDIHQNGATYYNVKELLGAVTESVICRNSGAVDYFWTEQDTQCMLVGEHVYTAPLTAARNFDRGSNVREGDVLFGSLKFMSSQDMEQSMPDATMAPGMSVMTDVGQLIAENAGKEAVEQDGVSVLPLVGSYGASTPGEYVELCVANAHEDDCAYIPVPSEVNPLQFVMCTLRRGCGILTSLIATGTKPVEEALECIRKSIMASGMMTVYVQAEGDNVVTVPSAFSAVAGNAAVAEDITVTAKNMFAEAEVML